jgi:hypothetical protein
MYRKAVVKSIAVSLAAGVLAASLQPSLAAQKLVLNGKVASTRVQNAGGQAVVPLADLARAMGMVVVRVAGGYEIRKAGGTYQVQGLNGKIGDVLFDGKWRFQVLRAGAPSSFTMKTNAGPDYAQYHEVAEFDNDSRTMTPKRGYKLIVVQCRVTNAVGQKRALWVAEADVKTAVTDTSGRSYSPVGYDFEGAPIQSQPLLQGAKFDFATLFSVPEDAQIKDLVFTLRTIAKGDARDVRVALGNIAP